MRGFEEAGGAVAERRRWRWKTGEVKGGERSWDKMPLAATEHGVGDGNGSGGAREIPCRQFFFSRAERVVACESKRTLFCCDFMERVKYQIQACACIILIYTCIIIFTTIKLTGVKPF
jgi:hypothetical protein